MCVYSPVYKAIKVSFPKQMKALREEREFSLEEMAEKIGIEVIQLGRYESGYAPPTLNALKKIAAALSIEVLLLLGYPCL